MSGYLRRLASTGAAYTAASIISKLIAVALLPLYTRYLTPSDYGAAEVLFAAVVAASIVIRLGVVEALLRFYYKTDEDPDKTVATSFAALSAGMRTVMPGLGAPAGARDRERGPPASRAAVLAAFVAVLVHTITYAGFLDDPITWVLIAIGYSLAFPCRATSAA